VVAGHLGDGAAAKAARGDSDPGVRALALGALRRSRELTDDELARAFADTAPVVRRRACEEVALLGDAGSAQFLGRLVQGLADRDATVVEAACFALGEVLGPVAQPRGRTAALDGLQAVATTHLDALCREAAVAALGAIGDPRGLPAILAATRDKAAVRRRAVLALAPFDGPEVDEALTRALGDRDWQVRQAAEDLGAT
jgi:HEAT repeat protein